MPLRRVTIASSEKKDVQTDSWYFLLHFSFLYFFFFLHSFQHMAQCKLCICKSQTKIFSPTLPLHSHIAGPPTELLHLQKVISTFHVCRQIIWFLCCLYRTWQSFQKFSDCLAFLLQVAMCPGYVGWDGSLQGCVFLPLDQHKRAVWLEDEQGYLHVTELQPYWWERLGGKG